MRQLDCVDATAELVREPRLRGAPIAQHRRFRDVEQLRGLGDIEAAEEPALDEQSPGAARARARSRQRFVEREEIVGAGRRRFRERFVERDDAPRRRRVCRRVAAARPRSSTCRIARAAIRLKCTREVSRDPRRVRELEPRFVDERRRAERRARIVAAHAGRESAQLLVGCAEQVVERLDIVELFGEFAKIQAVGHAISAEHDGFGDDPA